MDRVVVEMWISQTEKNRETTIKKLFG